MLILTIRTDKPEAELGLYDDENQLAYLTWEAHRKLAETIHLKLTKLLEKVNKSFNDVDGIVSYKGPGSFTGLRIGFSVANALADSIQVPIVAQSDKDWISVGINKIQSGQNDKVALPEYGSAPHITIQKK